MTKECDKNHGIDLPSCATEFIRQVVRKMGYRRKARQEVEAELTAYFEDELRASTDVEERESKAQQLVGRFGDAKLLAILCRRAKRRCRPFWAKAMVRTLQAAGVFLMLLVFYVIWFVSGRPIVKVDYLAMLNQMSRPEIADRDNAWPHYERAIALAVEPSPELQTMSAFKHPTYAEHRDFAALSKETRDAIKDWLEAIQPAWQQIVIGAAKPYLSRTYEHPGDVNEPWLLGIMLPELATLRDLARAGMWRSRVSVEQGRIDEALADCLVVARMGCHWQHGGTLIEQLVGLAFSKIACEEILQIVQRGDLSGEALSDLQRNLAGIYSERYPLIDVQFERLAFLDVVQRVFTNEGLGGGHLIPSAMSSLAPTEGGDADWEGIPFWRTARSVLHARRDETVAKASHIFDHLRELAVMSPYEKRDQRVATIDNMVDSLPKHRYGLVEIMLPALDRVVELRFRGKAVHEATLTVLALHRYHLEKGAYPTSLDELLHAGYVDSLPDDPYNDGPMAYRVTDSAFTLYSVGPDFEDDGGKMSTDREGRPKRWRENGDTVFWPVL